MIGNMNTPSTAPEGELEPVEFPNIEYLTQLLTARHETMAQQQVRECLTNVLQHRDPIEMMLVAGELIEYARDYVLSGLAAVRRTATVTARMSMSPDQIAQSTGLSRATVSRLITEHREI